MALASAYGPSLRFTVKEPVCPDGPEQPAPSSTTTPSTGIQLRMTIPSALDSRQAALPRASKGNSVEIAEDPGRHIEEPLTIAYVCWHFCARRRTRSGVLPVKRAPGRGANLARISTSLPL